MKHFNGGESILVVSIVSISVAWDRCVFFRFPYYKQARCFSEQARFIETFEEMYLDLHKCLLANSNEWQVYHTIEHGTNCCNTNCSLSMFDFDASAWSE